MAYQNIYHDDGIIHLWDDVDGYTKFPFKRYGYMLDSNGTFKTMNGLRAKKVTSWSKEAEAQNLVFEHDVPIYTRVLVDRYYKNDEPSINHNVLFFDIEVAKEGKYSTPREANNTLTSIAYYSSIEKKYHCLILDPNGNMSNRTMDNGAQVLVFKSEQEMLIHFVQFWQLTKPTIVTGWNSEFFDLPYLYNRLSNILGDTWAKKLSPIGIVESRELGRDYGIKIAGVSGLDYLMLYKNFTANQEPRYTLDFISLKELNRGKVQYTGSLDSLYSDDIEKFVEYNVSDVELVVALDKKLDYIEIARGICHKGNVPYEDIIMSSRYLDGALLTECKKAEIVTVSTDKKSGGDSTSAQGAFVKIPSPGLYQYVYDIDLESEYPNNIKSLNISPETKWGRVLNYSVDDYILKKDRIYVVEKINVKTLIDRWDHDSDCTTYTFKTWEDFNKFLVDTNLSISSAGILYTLEFQGLIPKILSKWGEERTQYRSTAKEYYNNNDIERYKYFDRKQYVQKILLNSLYGVLLLPTFRFYDKENGESVTLTGQTLVQFSADIGNFYYQKSLGSEQKVDYCLYTDTDSCFFEALPIIKHRYGDINHTDEFLVEKTLEIAKEVEDFINKSYAYYAQRYHNLKKHTWKIKQEMVGKTAFWRDKKKRYAMWIINKNGLNCDEVEVKGFDSVRSDFPKELRRFMSECISDILKLNGVEYMNNKVRDEKIKIVKTLPLTDILLPTGVKDVSKYRYGQKGTPIHVKAAHNYNKLMDLYKIESVPKIDDGDKIVWSYVSKNPYGFESLAIRGYDDPPQIVEFLEKYADRNRIFEDRLLNKLQSIWDNLGWGTILLHKENNFF